MIFSASCFATLILVGSSPSFQAANKDLFENWGTVLHIPSITIGVPTDMELQESTMLLDQIYEQLVVSSSEAISLKQRELDVPFALGMVEGIRAVSGDKNAAISCLNHCSELDDAVSGWSASRLWRMRIHAYKCLEDEDKINMCVEALMKVSNADIEDQLVAILHSKGTIRFDVWGEKLVVANRHDLRWDFASGVVNQDPLKNLGSIFSLTADLAKQGVSRRVLDNKTRELLERLDEPIHVSEEHDNRVVSILASRLKIHKYLQEQKYTEAKTSLLLLLAHDGVFSAELLVSNKKLNANDAELSESFSVLLQRTTETTFPESYLQLIAASHAVKVGETESAISLLDMVSETSDFYQDAQNMLQFLHGSDVDAIKAELESAANNTQKLDQVIATIQSPVVARRLLQYFISKWHGNRGENTTFVREVILALLPKSNGTRPALLGEANRLVGNHVEAKRLFEQSIDSKGETLQAVIGLAACNRDVAAMRRACKGLSLDGTLDYWFWFAHAHMIQWYCEDGGDKAKATAKVNRLKQLDLTLGGEQFASVFRKALR